MKLHFAFAVCLLGVRVHAWDYEGHRAVNLLAFAALPTNFPAFALAAEAKERVAFLSGEPDRWRNMGDGRKPWNDVVLSHFSGPDHYLDLENLTDVGLNPMEVPIFRYDFTVQLAKAMAAHPDKHEPIDPAKNLDHSRELAGFAPWAITEYCGKLRSGFSYLKAFQDYGGTAEEIANAQANIIYVMGVMGHFVGDCSQPLHVTKHHHGWVGPNPKGYATNSSFHSWIDGGFFRKTGGIKAEPLVAKVRPARIVNDPFKSDDLFKKVMTYLLDTHKELEPLYQLEKDRKLSGEPGTEREGRAFLETQIVKGGQMLGDLWYSSWQQAVEDEYLVRQLKERAKLAAEKK